MLTVVKKLEGSGAVLAEYRGMSGLYNPEPVAWVKKKLSLLMPGITSAPAGGVVCHVPLMAVVSAGVEPITLPVGLLTW